MSRAVVAMLACLVCGACGMWLASNFKVKLEPVAQPEATHPAPVAEKISAPSEPEKLPAHIVSRAPAPTGDVRQVGEIQAIPLVTAPQVIGVAIVKEDVFEVTEVVEAGVTVNWGKPGTNPVRLATEKPTLVLPVITPIGSKPLITIGGKAQDIGTYTGSSVALDLSKLDNTGATAPGAAIEINILRIEKLGENEINRPAVITVIRPLPNIDADRLFVDSASPTKNLAPQSLVDGAEITVVNDYLRAMGRGTRAFESASFSVLITGGNGKPLEVAQSKKVAQQPGIGSWEYEMTTKPVNNGDKGRLLIRGDFGSSGHMFVLAKGRFTFSTVDAAPLPAPTLNVAKATADTAIPASTFSSPKVVSRTGLNTVFANTRSTKVTVSAVDERAKAVSLYVDDKWINTIEPKSNTAVFDNVQIGDGQEHVIRAHAILGGIVGVGAQLGYNVVTSAPTIIELLAPSFGSSAGAVGGEKIRIKFNTSNPMDAATVQLAANFEVVHNEGEKTSLVTKVPILDPDTNTVSIVVDKVLPGSYTVRVRGAVKDIYGNALQQSGTAKDPFVYETILFTSGGGTLPDATAPIQSTGVTPTGKNAVFPVNTDFHPLKDGFNPSDRVETRVVRLYYYRDANRVAQIVNRDVRSFNGPAVDVRRRAAEKVRSEADNLQDERQSRERMAIRAAVATRAAENEVRQLEAKLQQARTDQATSRIQLGQREQQLLIAQRELDRSLASTLNRADNDPSVIEQRQRLQSLGKDDMQLKAEQSRLDLLVKNAEANADRQNDAQRNQVKSLDAEVAKLRQTQATAASTEQTTQAQLDAARSKVQGLRAEEIKLTEEALGKDSAERRKREEQFRREVAAALADPDIYVAGLPDSVDPVLQCSVSVIGEGLIQIRGPVKGLNIIRTMINQIDAPVGQVRVGVHTVQVNGERVEKMDQVIGSIQRYLDHSRFLTTQSAQMLRKAVTTVASRKAMEAEQTLGLGCTQADRDMKYLHCFFGKDFIDELKSLDSEFLKTGNKILSLHSMDSTSLSSALFLMSLAKNDIRQEILDEFKRQVEGKLPEAELNFYMAGLNCPAKCEAYTDRKFCVLAQNAKFESLFGFFNTEVSGNETLSPLQREFVRLAQIFKSRMVTEMELKQRVMERAILEDRVGNYQEEQRKAKEQEDKAKEDRVKYQLELQTAIVKASDAFSILKEQLDTLSKEISVLNELLDDIGTVDSATRGNVKRDYRLVGKAEMPTVASLLTINGFREDVYRAQMTVDRFNFEGGPYEADYKAVSAEFLKILSVKTDAGNATVDVRQFRTTIGKIAKLIQGQAVTARAEIADMLRELRKDRPNLELILAKYNEFYNGVEAKLRRNKNEETFALFSTKIAPAFLALQNAFVVSQASARSANLVRRSLDEKKLLDMLVDEMEDKYIELLDGTRAHTANVDNYLKALSTALDDDFITQFYNPAFRKVRSLGASWDVQLGQIESTSVLTNNRSFGKVSPTASMEFDLPRRDILMKEAFKSAKAAVQDYGALLNDPVFLSMVKMYGGAPMGAQFAGGLPAVRNVLPGLPSSADEMIMGQAGSNRKEFGTNVESLIADPAIYKIETGTGYEIRPVISPDGQAVVFGFDYMYTTDVREPVRADEKHLGRVKRHFVRTDVQLSNFEMREVSKYWVSAKIARTSKGVSLLQDIPVAGALFRPAPSASSSLQQNIIYSQAAIFPTLFDLMGLRYAPAIADVTPENLINDEFVVRGRRDYLRAFIFDYGASRVDDALRIMYGERRADLYRSQYTIPHEHPNGYRGPGLRQRDSELQEGYDPVDSFPPGKYIPGMHLPPRQDRNGIPPGVIIPGHPESHYSKPGGVPLIRPSNPLPPNSQPLPQPSPVPSSGVPNSVVPPKGFAPASPSQPLPSQNQPIRSGPVPLPPNQYFPK